MKHIKLITLAAGLSALCLPGYAEADTIYTFRSPDGTPLFTDRSVMPGGYELLSVRKGWDFTPRALSTDMRDLYDLEIQYAARSHGVEPALIKAVIHAESLFDRHAVSRVGAQGLMQLMPQTAAFLEVSNPFDPRQNISGGTRFLSYLMERFDSLEHVLAAYNAGEGNVRRYGGVPPFEETRRYVRKVQELLPRYRAQFEQAEPSNTLAVR